MAPSLSIPHFAPAFFLLLLVSPEIALAVNVTAILARYPDFSTFNRLLSNSGVGSELTGRSSLTLLAVPNSLLLRSDLVRSSADGGGGTDVSDVIRYHVLLQYLSWPDLRQIPSSGKLIATLYQTTGRASGDLGAVNLTRESTGAVTLRSPAPFSASNATILYQIKILPYNVSIFAVDSLLLPYGLDLAASETRPQPVALNITRVLIDGKNFNVAASLLEASGVVEEFEDDERGAGITIFVPTDEVFGELTATERLQSLPADRKAVVLRFHVLHSYYHLGSLESIVNPVQPTLATEDVGAGRFTLNISRVNGSVAIDTGLVQASITRTVYDQNPVAVFAVSRVLIPREIFGKAASLADGAERAPPPAAMGGVMSPARASSPETMAGETNSSGGGNGGNLFCTEMLYLLLLFFCWYEIYRVFILICFLLFLFRFRGSSFFGTSLRSTNK